jgi:hypothetical protein
MPCTICWLIILFGGIERMAIDTQVSAKRKAVAVALGIVSLLCAVLFYLSFAFVMWQSIAGVYDGPILVFVALFFTLPPSIVCTVIALFLVGPRRCKLAWMSLCSYPLFFILVLIVALCAPRH